MAEVCYWLGKLDLLRLRHLPQHYVDHIAFIQDRFTMTDPFRRVVLPCSTFHQTVDDGLQDRTAVIVRITSPHLLERYPNLYDGRF